MIRKESQEKFSYVVLQKRPRLSLGKVTPKPTQKSLDSFGTWTQPLSQVEMVKAAPGAKAVDPTPLKVLERFVDVDEEEIQEVVDKLIDEVKHPFKYNCWR